MFKICISFFEGFFIVLVDLMKYFFSLCSDMGLTVLMLGFDSVYNDTVSEGISECLDYSSLVGLEVFTSFLKCFFNCFI